MCEHAAGPNHHRPQKDGGRWAERKPNPQFFARHACRAKHPCHHHHRNYISCSSNMALTKHETLRLGSSARPLIPALNHTCKRTAVRQVNGHLRKASPLPARPSPSPSPSPPQLLSPSPSPSCFWDLLTFMPKTPFPSCSQVRPCLCSALPSWYSYCTGLRHFAYGHRTRAANLRDLFCCVAPACSGVVGSGWKGTLHSLEHCAFLQASCWCGLSGINGTHEWPF